MDFVIGVIIGGLSLSACWGGFWLVIGAVGAARGVSNRRAVINSLVMGISPLLLGWAVWWMRAEGFPANRPFIAGILVMPALLLGLAMRRASDGRPVGLHMIEGIRHVKDQLLGTHQDCGDCGRDHGADRAGG